MLEDKLTHSQRRRLECLAQAVAANAMKHGVSAEQIVQDAKRFDEWVGEEK